MRSQVSNIDQKCGILPMNFYQALGSPKLGERLASLAAKLYLELTVLFSFIWLTWERIYW